MLKTVESPSPPSSQGQLKPALQETTDFPPPARDLAEAAFPARAPIRLPREIIALTVIDELDQLATNAGGDNAVSRTLQNLGYGREKAVAQFVGRASEKVIDRSLAETPLAMIEKITGVPDEKINCQCPKTARELRQMTGFEDPAAVSRLTRQLIDDLVANGGVPLRLIAIESVTRFTMEGPHEYDSRKADATREYEKLIQQISNPRASELLRYYAAGTGKAMATAGIFIYNSLIIENLPVAVKEKLKIDRDVDIFATNKGKDFPTYVASALLTGTLQAALLSTLTPGFKARPLEEALAMLITTSVIMGGALEWGLRVCMMFQKGIPGWSVLELACLPWYAGRKALSAVTRLKNKMREQRIEKLKAGGL